MAKYPDVPPAEEHPDELRVSARSAGAGSALADFLRETADWDPAVEPLVNVGHDDSGQELVTAARRLIEERLVTEPSQIARLLRLLAGTGVPPGGDAPAGPRHAHDLGPDPLGAGIPLVGRETERKIVARAMARSRQGVSVACVSGPAGAGKTRLARELVLNLGEQSAARLRVSLSRPAPGMKNRQAPTTPYEALASLLGQLGVPDGEIPATLDGRRDRYVRELADQCPVILLDGALDTDQVTLLLPPRRGSVVITSLSGLTGLTGPNVQFVALGRLPGDWPGRLAQRVFEVLGVAPDGVAAEAIQRLSDGLPGPAVLLARWAAATAKAEGLTTTAVTARLEAAHRDGERAAAVLGLLDDDQQAVLRALALPGLPQADQWTLALSTGLSRERVKAAIGRLAQFGLVGAGEGDGTWSIALLAAGYVRAQAVDAGEPAQASYERALGPVIGLYGMRARALCDLMATDTAEPGSAVQGWAVSQWRAERARLAAVMEAAAAAAHPAVARRLAAAFMDAAAAAAASGEAGGWRASEACVEAVARIARDAGDQNLERRALEWLEAQDRLTGLSRKEPPAVDPPGDPPGAAPATGLRRIEERGRAVLNAVPRDPVLFGAGDRRS
jgi:AAA ATPase domain